MAQQMDRLRNWTASLEHKLAADKTEGKFRFLTKPKFKCVMCKKDIITTPVFQCQTGHLACLRCSKKGRSCLSCDEAISRIKNVAIGKIIDSLYVTCKHRNLGCKNTCQFKSYRDHEKTCSFAPMNCPMPDCKQAGVTNFLEENLKSKHKISALVDLSFISSYYSSYRDSASFNLDSLTTKVLLRHTVTSAKDFHLLHK